MHNRRIYLILFLITAATLVLELSMTRVFSVLMYYHFAFMAISLALFGLGASGLYIYLRANHYSDEKLQSKAAYACLLMALSIVICLIVSLQMKITMDYSGSNVMRLIIIYLVSLPPFFFSGLAVSMILFVRAKDISRLYFFDLCGAACGAALTVPLLNLVGAINAQIIVAALAALAGLIAAWNGKALTKWLAVTGVVIGLVLFIGNTSLDFLKVRYHKGVEYDNIEFEKSNAFSNITVRPASDDGSAKSITIDADALTFFLRDPFRTIGEAQIRDKIAGGLISHIPHIFSESKDVLIIGPGGGLDVVFALAYGAKSVDGAEINPIIINDVMLGKYREYTGGLYQMPNVKIYESEGRSFIARSQRHYDVIQLTLVDTWAASSAGAFSLSENNLYTVEAFVDYLSHLNDDGILAVTRWLTPKPKESLRLLTLAFEAAERLQIPHPETHMAIVGRRILTGESEVATFMFKRTPFTETELAKIEQRATETGSAILWLPGRHTMNYFTQLLTTEDRKQFLDRYEYDVSPTTDDHPFFFNTVRSAELKKIVAMDGESQKNNVGVFVLFVISLISAAVVILFLVVPLFFLKGGSSGISRLGAARTLTYFIAIGVGFILIEIALMQKFILYLGHPIYALAVVLTSMLIFSGLGSLWTNRYDRAQGRQYGNYLFPAIVAVVGVLLLLLPILFRATFDLPLAARIVFAVLVLAPVGLLMGQPFPLEFKHLESRANSLLPWAWSMNGAASVLGSVAAVALAMTYGFNVALMVGLACYVVAFAARARTSD